MAVRRLLIVMLILLGLSTLAAALVPSRPNQGQGTGSTTPSEAPTQTVPADAVPVGKPLKLSIEVGVGPVVVVPMRVGDQLELVVSSSKRDQLEIPALGLVETVGPDLPARFEVFAREPGDLGIRYTEADRVVARIEVAPRKDADPGQPAQD